MITTIALVPLSCHLLLMLKEARITPEAGRIQVIAPESISSSSSADCATAFALKPYTVPFWLCQLWGSESQQGSEMQRLLKSRPLTGHRKRQKPREREQFAYGHGTCVSWFRVQSSISNRTLFTSSKIDLLSSWRLGGRLCSPHHRRAVIFREPHMVPSCLNSKRADRSGVRETGSGDIIQEGEAVAAEGAEFPGRSSVLSP